MADDLAGLNELRGEILRLMRLLDTPGCTGGQRRRASKALGAVALKVVDLAALKLGERQKVFDDGELV